MPYVRLRETGADAKPEESIATWWGELLNWNSEVGDESLRSGRFSIVSSNHVLGSFGSESRLQLEVVEVEVEMVLSCKGQLLS